MKPNFRRNIFLIIVLLLLLFILPLIIYLTRKRQDIRPRALVGAANFTLSDDLIDDRVLVGGQFHVNVSLLLTNANVKVTGVDFVLLYDKARLAVKSINPATTGVNAYFSEAPIVSTNGSFSDRFAFLRVAQVAKKGDSNLSSGPIPVASITFQALNNGEAMITFPEDNKYLQVTGIGPTGTVPSEPPFSSPTPTIPSGGPSPTTVQYPTPTVPPVGDSCQNLQGTCANLGLCEITGGQSRNRLDCPANQICCVGSFVLSPTPPPTNPTPTPVLGSTCQQLGGSCSISFMCTLLRGQDKGKLNCGTGQTCCVISGGVINPPSDGDRDGRDPDRFL